MTIKTADKYEAYQQTDGRYRVVEAHTGVFIAGMAGERAPMEAVAQALSAADRRNEELTIENTNLRYALKQALEALEPFCEAWNDICLLHDEDYERAADVYELLQKEMESD